MAGVDVLLDAAAELGAREPGHHHVGEDDLRLAGEDLLPALLAVGGGGDLVEGFEEPHEHVAQRLVVLDNQHTGPADAAVDALVHLLALAGEGTLDMRRGERLEVGGGLAHDLPGGESFAAQGQPYGEGRAAARLARGLEAAVVELCDALREG